MNTKIKTLIFLFVALIFLGAHRNIALAGGFGVSPASVLNDNLVPGSFFEEDVILVQSSPTEDLNAAVTINAGKINNWIKIENGNNFIIPKGVQQFPMKVDVSVPLNADLGEYKGTIVVNTSSVGALKTGVSVTLGANVGIDLKVTSLQFSDFSIQNFKILDTKQGSPINFVMKVKNDGNVENGPTKVGLTFFDQYHSKQLGQYEQNITERVQSFQTKDVSVQFPNNLDVGSYWADVKIYTGDKVIIDSKMVFAVVAGAPSGLSFLKLPNFSAVPLWVYMMSVAIIVIVVLVIVIIVILRKKK
jgi:hypothetical protein